MMIKKQHWPFITFILISLSYIALYKTTNPLNEFGKLKPEWPLLIDTFVVIPLVCFVCIKDKSQALIKAAAYICILILLGSWLIPDTNKQVWHSLEYGRYLILAIFLCFEISAIFTVLFALKHAINTQSDLDVALSHTFEKLVGKGKLSQFLALEARAWSFALFAKHIKATSYIGHSHFSYHKKDDSQSNALGFIMLIAFEIPLMHLVLHFLVNSTTANLVTAITIFSLVFFIAEYRAMSRRPISLSNTHLIIHFGIYNPYIIDLNNIKSITTSHGFIAKQPQRKRYRFSGNPNVKIVLKRTVHDIEEVYVSVDNPSQLILTVSKNLKPTSSNQLDA